MIKLFQKTETEKYIIIKILFIKITFKKKSPKSDIDAIVWWIPFKNLRNAIRNIYYEYKNNLNQANGRIDNLYSNMHRRFDDLYPFMWDRFWTLQNNFNEQKKELLISRNLNYQSHCEDKKLYFENIKNMPLVSVIIPVYNIGEKYLIACLESVINQTLKNIEIIIVNDCSPLEEDEKIILEYKNKDNRIKYIKNEENLGLAQSRIEGLKVATGYAVSFIDSDDFASLNLYEITIYEMLKNNVDIVCYNHFRVEKTADGNILYNSFLNNIPYQTFYDKDVINLFCNKPVVFNGYTWTKLVKRDIILNLGFDIANGMKNCIYNDVDLTFKIFIASKSMIYLPLNLHFYITDRETAITNMYSLKDNAFTDLYTLYYDLYEFLEKKNNSYLTQLLASNLSTWIYYRALEFDNYKVKENNHFINILEKVILDLIDYGAIDKNQLLENVKNITNDNNLINWLCNI